jgi:hypothetical protein
MDKKPKHIPDRQNMAHNNYASSLKDKSEVPVRLTSGIKTQS